MHALVRSELLLQVFPGKFAVSEDLGKQAFANGLTTVNGDDCASTIRMAEKVVASFGPDYVKPELPKGLDQLDATDCGTRAHAVTATRCTPTN